MYNLNAKTLNLLYGDDFLINLETNVQILAHSYCPSSRIVLLYGCFTAENVVIALAAYPRNH